MNNLAQRPGDRVTPKYIIMWGVAFNALHVLCWVVNRCYHITIGNNIEGKSFQTFCSHVEHMSRNQRIGAGHSHNLCFRLGTRNDSEAAAKKVGQFEIVSRAIQQLKSFTRSSTPVQSTILIQLMSNTCTRLSTRMQYKFNKSFIA